MPCSGTTPPCPANTSVPATSASGGKIVLSPVLRAIETAPIAGSNNSVILGEALSGASIVVNFEKVQESTSGSSGSGTSSSESSSGTTSNGLGGSSSDATSSTSSGEQNTSSSSVTNASASSGEAASTSNASTPSSDEGSPVHETQTASEAGVVAVRENDDGINGSSFVREVRKSAREIRELRDEARTRKAGSSDKHEFDFSRGNLDRLEVEFSGNVENVSAVVNTLAISKVRKVQDVYRGEIDQVVDETSDDGTVNTPSEIVAPESVPAIERDIEIDVGGGNRLPDIESRVIEEVRPVDKSGSVVRTITKKKAYKYLRIDLQGASASSVERALIGFDVPKSWVGQNGGDVSKVRLNRYVDGNWVELSTDLVGEDASNYKFVAESPGFSFFVITAAITADITTPIKIEVPEQQAAAAQQKDDFVGDLLGTTQPQSILTINISWLLAVVVLGMVVLFKFNDIKRAMGFMHAKQDRVRELEEQKTKYERMKEETTKRFYKRIISEDEFKNLVMEYDKQLISIETEMAQLKDGKKGDGKEK